MGNATRDINKDFGEMREQLDMLDPILPLL